MWFFKKNRGKKEPPIYRVGCELVNIFRVANDTNLGFVQLASKKRLSGIKLLISSRAHCEVARGSAEQNRVYCTKEAGRIRGPYEFGNMIGRGKRVDLEALVEFADTNEITDEIMVRQFPNIDARFPNWVDKLKRMQKEKEVRRPSFSPREGWQTELVSYLAMEPNPRKVRWYYDAAGASGKSFFAANYDAAKSYVVTGGRHADIYVSYYYEPVVFFDLARSAIDKVPYEVMENFKNGYFLSTKYQVKRMRFNIPHVIVFANFEPDRTQLSADRWDVHVINERPFS